LASENSFFLLQGAFFDLEGNAKVLVGAILVGVILVSEWIRPEW
jgi:hypothetical protein